jgi:uncharacterized protein with NAD-binding domain and iron-sulfur cluster
LPGEHGYRVEFGFYQNVPDTMRRIPFGSNGNGVFDNMVELPQFGFSRVNRSDLVLPLGALDPRPYTPAQIKDLIVGVLLETDLPPEAAVRFADRLVVFFSSCDARRLGQWERTSWSEFIGADDYSEDYRKILGGLPQILQASKPARTSAKFMGWVFEVLVHSLLGFGSNGPAIRVLNLPTNEAWIDPWLAHLRHLGVRLHNGHELIELEVRDGRVRRAWLRTPRGTRVDRADFYVSALPVERARRLLTPALLAVDPGLGSMRMLGTAWMNGVQFYLRDQLPLIRGGFIFTDSPWAVAGGTQAQFWSVDFASTYGDGRVHDKLSVALADWATPGVLYGKPASECTPDEVVQETWEQIKRHLNKSGKTPRLTDDMLLSHEIDPGMILHHGHLVSEDALVLPTLATEQYRPDTITGIPNLMLCGDYLNGRWEVANMEAACCNGRRAANAILAAASSQEPPASTTPPYRPPEWEALKRIDEQRYKQGQPNLFDVDTTLDELKNLLSHH